MLSLLANASVEVSARDSAVTQKLAERFPRGTDTHVTFLPNDERAGVESTCAALRRAGFNPIPHLTARSFASREALDAHLGRLADGAGVATALVIAGDADRPRGALASSIDLMRTDLLQKHGIRSIRIAGHPEGHPAVAREFLDAALQEKTAFARDHGLGVEIVTQFCFDPAPILSWLEHIRGLGITAPVRLGVAGPANSATLLKFALRCGIGNSLRVLRRRTEAVGKLMSETRPDELLRQVSSGADNAGLGPLAGIHLYVFGGLQKTSEWLRDARSAWDAETAAPRFSCAGS